MGFCSRASSSLGNECFRPRCHVAGHTYPENGSPRVGWLDARVPPGLGQRRKQAGWFGGVTHSAQRSDVELMLWVTLGIGFLGGWPLLFSLEWWGLYTIWGVWLSSRLPLEGVDHICIHGQ
jgi:hypothetical protein